MAELCVRVSKEASLLHPAVHPAVHQLRQPAAPRPYRKQGPHESIQDEAHPVGFIAQANAVVDEAAMVHVLQDTPAHTQPSLYLWQVSMQLASPDQVQQAAVWAWALRTLHS